MQPGVIQPAVSPLTTSRSGWIGSFTYASGAVQQRFTWTLNVNLGNVLSFGEDSAGELYVLSGSGAVYRITQ